MARTYIPKLNFLAHLLNRYGERYRSQLQENLNAEQFACFIALLNALNTFITCLGESE